MKKKSYSKTTTEDTIKPASLFMLLGIYNYFNYSPQESNLLRRIEDISYYLYY